MPGNYPEESIQHLEHSKSLKSISTEVSALITSGMHNITMIFCFVVWTSLRACGCPHPKTNKQGASGKRKHLVVTIPQKLERIRRLESNISCIVITATHNIGLSTVLYKEMEVPICMAQKVSVKGPQKRWMLQQPK
jgi:hypothetical protein